MNDELFQEEENSEQGGNRASRVRTRALYAPRKCRGGDAAGGVSWRMKDGRARRVSRVVTNPAPLNPRDFFVFKPVSRPARFTGDGYVGANAGNSANRAVSTSNYKLTTTTTATFFHASLDIDFAIEIYRNRGSGYFHLESAGPGMKKSSSFPKLERRKGRRIDNEGTGTVSPAARDR